MYTITSRFYCYQLNRWFFQEMIESAGGITASANASQYMRV
jgi:hypothetical protein